MSNGYELVDLAYEHSLIFWFRGYCLYLR